MFRKTNETPRAKAASSSGYSLGCLQSLPPNVDAHRVLKQDPLLRACTPTVKTSSAWTVGASWQATA